jgi:hypothetical protein
MCELLYVFYRDTPLKWVSMTVVKKSNQTLGIIVLRKSEDMGI